MKISRFNSSIKFFFKGEKVYESFTQSIVFIVNQIVVIKWILLHWDQNRRSKDINHTSDVIDGYWHCQHEHH